MSNKKFRILSIDGGGLRGLIPLQVIKQIEELTNEPIHKSFDLIAGTSTGGLLACALTLQDFDATEAGTRKFDLIQIEDIYKNRGKLIFPISKNIFSKNINKISKWFRPQFNAFNLNEILIEYFGDNRITSCLRPLFITSFNIHRNIPIFFTTREASLFSDKNSKLTEVCRATSAAPTYFQSHSFDYNSEKIVCVDGGVIMNNPTIGALVEVLGNSDYKHYRIENKRLNLEDITILSLGTGRSNKILKSNDSKNWGRLKWIKPIIDISTGGPVKMVDQQISTIFKSSGLENNYLRIDIDIDVKFSEMSDSSQETLNYILSESNSQIKNNHTLINKLKLFLDSNVINKEEKIDNMRL